MKARFLGAMFLWLLAGCGSAPRQSASLGTSLNGEVREYIRLAVALGERDPDALDYYYGPPEWVADIRRSPPALARIQRSASAAVARLKKLPASKETEFLIGQWRAMEARVDLLMGVKRSFDEESFALFGTYPAGGESGLPSERRAEARRQAGMPDPTVRELARLLPGTGTLAHRYEVFDTKFRIPPDRVPGVMTRALQACREQTIAHIRLPPEERVTVEYVNNKPWSAYSYYRGDFQSVIQINADLGLTVDRALDLACHEGYPGHHVINVLTDQQLVRAGKRLEFLVQLTFSPQSFLSEAEATNAPDVAFSEPERVRVEREALFPLAGLKSGEAERYVRVERLVDALHPAELSIARAYLDGTLEFVRAGSALEEQALMAHSDATLRYLNEFRTYVVTYTEGRDQVKKWIDARPEGRWAAFQELIAHPEVFARH